MGAKLSCVSSNSSISTCPLSLEELVKFESELQNAIISEMGVIHLMTHFAENVKVIISVCNTLESFEKFEVTTMPNNSVLITKEQDTSYLYSVLYKNKNGQLYYKNSHGVQPSGAFSSKLQHDDVIVNTCYDGPPGEDGQHWMALQNAVNIVLIANQHEDIQNYVKSKEFCKRKYSAALLRQIHKSMAAKININEIRKILQSENFEKSDIQVYGEVDSIVIKAFVILCNNAESKIKKKLRRKCATDKSKIMRLVQLYATIETQSSDVADVADLDALYCVRLLKEEYNEMVSSALGRIDDKLRKRWANAKKGEWRKIAAYCVIAMERALKIKVRDNQLMAVVLIFMYDKPTFLEIKTGEGKTLIIALVAAVQVLLGHKVDIITCNDLLASENAKEMIVFYLSVGITSACNKDKDINPYTCDVVYGSMNQWQFDYLRNCLDSEDEARNERKYDCCILDEVDLLTVDHCQHIAKISKPFPGMKCLQNIYYCIYENKDISLEEYPKYLRPYCEYMTPIWKYNRQYLENKYEENVNYCIQKDRHRSEQNRIQCIIPIDAENTGALMHNSVFSDGMQQFLEWHHNLSSENGTRSAELLNSIFISNHGFIRLYQHHVFGVTGTLGSVQEQQILKSLFPETSLLFYCIPTFKESKFQEYEVNYVLEDADAHIMELSKPISNNVGCNNVCVFVGENTQIRNRLAKINNINQTVMLGGEFNDEVMQCIYEDKFTIAVGQSQYQKEDTLLKDMSEYKVMIIKNNIDLCRAKLVDKLIELCGTPIGNKDEYITKLRQELEIITGTELNCNNNAIVNELNLSETYLGVGDEVYIFNHSFDDKSELIIENIRIHNHMYYKLNLLFTNYFFNVSYNKNIDNNNNNRVDIVINSIIKNNQDKLIDSIMEIINTKRRALLVICRDVSKLNELKTNLLNSQFKKQNLYTYTGLNVKVKNEIESLDTFQIKCGQVLLTTNIGGRGADFQTTPELEANGGLHVILTFLPINDRVQRQAFGRTARNGRSGTGQLVLNQIDVMLHFNCDEMPAHNELISKRNNLNLLNLHRIETVTLNKMRFQDDMATCYIEFYKMKKQEARNDEMLYRIQDTNECWAFWLKLKKYKTTNEEDVKTMKANEKFSMFLQHAENIINGQAYFNPCYAVKRANYYFERHHFDEAQRIFEAIFDEEVFTLETHSECLIFAGNAIHKSVLMDTAKQALQFVFVGVQQEETITKEFIEILTIEANKQEAQNLHANQIDFINEIEMESNVKTYAECIQKFLESVNALQTFYNKYSQLPPTWSSSLMQFANGFGQLNGNKEDAKAAFEEGYAKLKQIAIPTLLKSSLHFLWNLGEHYIYDPIAKPITDIIKDFFPFGDSLISKATDTLKERITPVIQKKLNYLSESHQYEYDNMTLAIASLEMYRFNQHLKLAIDNIVRDKLVTTKSVTVSQLIRILNEEAYNLQSFTAQCQGAWKEFIKEKLDTFLTRNNTDNKYEKETRIFLNNFLLDIEQLTHNINNELEKHGHLHSDGTRLTNVPGFLSNIYKDNMLPALRSGIINQINEENRKTEAKRAKTADVNAGI